MTYRDLIVLIVVAIAVGGWLIAAWVNAQDVQP